MAGLTGFVGMTGKNLVNRFFRGGHSFYFEISGQPNDRFMETYWVPAILDDGPFKTVDERPTPTWRQGIFITIAQNFEIIKLLIYTVVLLIPAFVLGILYREANQQRERADHTRDEALKTLIWAFNRSAFLGYDGEINENSRPLLIGILQRLRDLKYDDNGGYILLIGHEGMFAIIRQGPGKPTILATNDNIRGVSPLKIWWGDEGEATSVAAQKLEHTARQLAASSGIAESKYQVQAGKENDVVTPPSSKTDVDAWNRAATLNNRIELRLCIKGKPPSDCFTAGFVDENR